MFTVDPTHPFAQFVNTMIGYAASPFMSPAAFANQAKQSFEGDPLAGQKVPGSSLAWNDATQVQQFISTWYTASGNKTPDNFDAILNANAGPQAPWNFSYEKWKELGIIK